jgi:antitoxin MazE
MNLPQRSATPVHLGPLPADRSLRIINVDTKGGDGMRARVQKWGNSLALRIPKALAELAGLAEGKEVDLAVEDGRLVVRPRRQPRYTLEELVAQITDENLHGEIGTGPSVGNEAW